MLPQNYNLFIFQIDQKGISPHKIDTFSCKKVMKRKKNIYWEILFDLTPSFSVLKIEVMSCRP